LNSPFVFQLSRPDLVALLARLRIFERDEKSVLAPLIDEARLVPSRQTDADLGDFLDAPEVAKILAIISRPSVSIDNRVGGGVHAIEFFTACHAPDIDAQAISTILPSAAGACLFTLHASPSAYLSWWLSSNAAPVSEAVPHQMLPPLDLEAGVYIMHALDLFRRCMYEGLLAHETTDRPAIKPEAFPDSLLSAISSRDMRWLTPAFIGLTPGLSFEGFGKSPEPIAQLARLDILVAGEGTSGNPVLIFGEAGQRMGVEFYHSWFRSAGFETSARTRDGWTTINRGFLAPTGLANHLFLLTDGDGVCHVNHQPLTRDQLDSKLARMLADAIASISGEAPSQRPAPRVSVARSAGTGADASKSQHCESCGQPLQPESKFCPHCGVRVADLSTGARRAANGGKPADLPE
jgi:predicted RNA-binding Zn-ribbon protein involved in translation (DUF1610 family)